MGCYFDGSMVNRFSVILPHGLVSPSSPSQRATTSLNSNTIFFNDSRSTPWTFGATILIWKLESQHYNIAAFATAWYLKNLRSPSLVRLALGVS